MMIAYKINSHYCFHGFKFSKDISGKGLLDDSCKYNLMVPGMTNSLVQINKLVGLSAGINHHKNSVRIGWTYDENLDKFNLYFYYYVNGVRSFRRITTVKSDELFHWRVRINGSIMSVEVNGIKASVEIDKAPLISYVLWPYFGGELPFPNEDPCYVNLRFKKW